MRIPRGAAAVPGSPVARIAAGIAAAALVGVLTAAPAEAHTTLQKAVPAKGATVPSPAKVELTYADPVRFAGVVVLDSKGGHHESGRPNTIDNRVTEQVSGALTPGVYTVGWRAVAPDGHPVTGEYRFTVAGSATSPPASGQATGRPITQPAAQSAERASGAGWWWVGLGTLIVAAVAGGVALFRRRRAE